MLDSLLAAASDDLVRVCNRCGQATPARPPAVGDITMGVPRCAYSCPLLWLAPRMALLQPMPGARVELPRLQLPKNFTQRITRLLPANTLPHIPTSCCLRMIAATAQCWQGTVWGSHDFPLLEEARSKLLLASVPPRGLAPAAEVGKRFTLWEECRFEDLLGRAEEQLLIQRKTGKRKKRDAQPDPPSAS